MNKTLVSIILGVLFSSCIFGVFSFVQESLLEGAIYTVLLLLGSAAMSRTIKKIEKINERKKRNDGVDKV